MKKKSKILFSYFFCLLIVLIGWFFIIRYNRRNTFNSEYIQNLKTIFEEHLNNKIKIVINEIKDEEFQKLSEVFTLIFKNQKYSFEIVSNKNISFFEKKINL